jgi:hypothetical protein
LTAKEITANKNLPTDSVYHKRFGSLTEAYRLIGYDVNTFNKEKFKLELANKYKELAKMLNRTPTSRDLDFYSKKGYCNSASTYIAYFGSIHDLQKYCGLIPTEVGRGKTKEELIKDLIWLKNELGRTPNQLDLNNYPHLASPSTYLLKFGSFVNALNEAGMESNKHKVYYTKSGTKCFSRMEHLFAQMLEKYKNPYEKDVKYSTWIKNIDKKYTFDFVIECNNRKYFVEIFGIEGNEFYNKNKNKKIEICKKNNIPLICLHFDFFWRVKQKEMYNNLILKIKEIDQKLTI